MTTSVIICTMDRPDDIFTTLQTVFNQTVLPDEVIVVDASYNKKTEDIINSLFKSNIIYIKSTPGLTYQRNQGIKKASCDVLHFLDDDVDLDPHYFENIGNVYANDTLNEIYGVGGRLTNIYSSFANTCLRKIFLLPHVNGNGSLQRSGFPAFQWNSKILIPKATEILCGLCSYRKEVFKEFNFDEVFSGYGYMEDVDFSYSVSRKYKLFYTPNAKVYHRETPVARMKIKALFTMIVKNHRYVFNKHFKQNFINRMSYRLSQFGLGILAVKEMATSKSIDPATGYFTGICSKC